MRIGAQQCNICKDIVYSRATHDNRSCSCGGLHVDGGFDYTKVSFSRMCMPTFVQIEVDATKKEMYDDWNKRRDKYGRIPKGRFRKYERLFVPPIDINLHDVE